MAHAERKWGLPRIERVDDDQDEEGPRLFPSELRLVRSYRWDELEWSIAGNGLDVLSELEWEELEAQEFGVDGRARLPYKLYLRGNALWSDIGAGENRDSDWDPLTGIEAIRSENVADAGDLSDFAWGLGYRGLRFDTHKGTSFLVAPLIGFAYHKQNLEIQDGVEIMDVFNDTSIPLGPFAGLNSRYDAEWYGPWAGLDFVIRPASVYGLHLVGGIEGHLMEYTAIATWNLRSDFEQPDSFEHDANGLGLVTHLGLRKNFGRRISVQLSGRSYLFKTEDGRDKVNLSDGRVSKTKLNEVRWRSYSVMLALGLMF